MMALCIQYPKLFFRVVITNGNYQSSNWQISELIRQLSVLIRQISAVICQLSELIRQLSAVFCQLSVLIRQISELIRQISELFRQLSVLIRQISALNQQISTVFGQISTLICRNCVFHGHAVRFALNMNGLNKNTAGPPSNYVPQPDHRHGGGRTSIYKYLQQFWSNLVMSGLGRIFLNLLSNL